jgi:hypothetical protein
MRVPFTLDQFLDVFGRYNEAVWPLQLLLLAMAAVAIAAAVRGGRSGSRVASTILAILWIWMGVVYHALFFRPINPAALLFAVAFVAEGVLIAWLGVVRSTLKFKPHRGAGTTIGFVLILYALLIYPAIGYAIGHSYPLSPTFGVPCPTTIFTFGMLLLCASPRSRAVLVIPAAWAVLGAFAATRLGMWEDIGLVVAAVVAITVVLRDRGTRRPHAHRRTMTAAAH